MGLEAINYLELARNWENQENSKDFYLCEENQKMETVKS